MRNHILFIVILLTVVSCTQKKNVASDQYAGEYLTQWMPSAPAIIYKTRGDYSHLVPVIMNEARDRIISYPDPGDLKADGKLMLPQLLNNGFLLDNRGINERVAFLSITYEEYSKLSTPPSIIDMMLKLYDRYPLKEMYQCGLRSDYVDLIYELNVLIDRGLTNCKRIDIIPASVILE